MDVHLDSQMVGTVAQPLVHARLVWHTVVHSSDLGCGLLHLPDTRFAAVRPHPPGAKGTLFTTPKIPYASSVGDLREMGGDL